MSNQRVIYSEVKLAKYPKRQQTKPRSKNSCSISDSEQQITYVGLKLHNAAKDLQGNDKKSHCKDFPVPPGRLIAGTPLPCLDGLCNNHDNHSYYSCKTGTEQFFSSNKNPKKAWFMYSNNCYYISVKRKSWNESWMDCVSKKSHLLYIDNEEEMCLNMFLDPMTGPLLLPLPRRPQTQARKTVGFTYSFLANFSTSSWKTCGL
ncbi:NKG2-A/NKG2-B type II integral membrane protein-like [Dugong dugon]